MRGDGLLLRAEPCPPPRRESAGTVAPPPILALEGTREGGGRGTASGGTAEAGAPTAALAATLGDRAASSGIVVPGEDRPGDAAPLTPKPPAPPSGEAERAGDSMVGDSSAL